MANTTVKTAKKIAAPEDPNFDVTAQKQALTNTDVENQDAYTRLWQSYDTTYNSKIRDSDRAYDRNISQADNAAQARGMGRSSYALQTRANIGQEKINAQNNINSEKIAAFQQALNNLQQWMQEQDNWQKNYDLTLQQFDYQKEQDKLANEWKQKEFDESVRQFNAQLNAAGGSGGGGGGGYSRGGYNPPSTPPASTPGNLLGGLDVGSWIQNLFGGGNTGSTTTKKDYQRKAPMSYVNVTRKGDLRNG